MSTDWDTNKPLEYFFPRLATLDALEVELRKEFGERTPAIISKLKSGQSLVDDELTAHDIIADLIGNNSETLKSLFRGKEADDYEDDWVNIMRFGTGRGHCVYWLDHMGDDTGYFGSIKAAKEYAEIMFIA